MTVEVNAPQEYQGSVLAGLTKRNAIFLGTDSNEGYFTSYCEVGDFYIMSLYELTTSNYLVFIEKKVQSLFACNIIKILGIHKIQILQEV